MDLNCPKSLPVLDHAHSLVVWASFSTIPNFAALRYNLAIKLIPCPLSFSQLSWNFVLSDIESSYLKQTNKTTLASIPVKVLLG